MMLLLLAALLAQDAVPTDAEGEAAAHRYREEIARASIEGKIAAIHDALKIEHERVIRAVGEALTNEADAVRKAAAKALGDVDHPASVEVLLKGLAANERRADVAPAVVEALGSLGWQSAAGALNELVRRVGDADVRAFLPDAIKAIGEIGSLSSIDPLIDLIQKIEGPRRAPWPGENQFLRAAHVALRAITGQDLQKAQAWEDWWKANQGSAASKVTRVYWLKKTQDVVALVAGEKAPADALLVASRLNTPPPAGTPGLGKKKKKK